MQQRVAVNDESTCQKAAEELSGSSMNVKMASENWENWPTGCYLQRSNTKVFFNEHRTGSKNDDAYQLCRFGGKGKNSYLTCFQLVYHIIQSKQGDKMLRFFSLLVRYGLENKGATECQTGSKVLDKSQCVSACKHLNIAMGTVPLQDGKPCFRGIHAASGGYQCRQLASLGVKANLICQSSGDQQYFPFSVIIIKDM